MSKSTNDLCVIMRAGGGVSIPCNKSTNDLCTIARAGASSGATLIVKNAGEKSTNDLCTIGRANPGHVIFDFD
ncbi:MAG: hypothetical protein QM504_02725 [Pseudomonadota bacterium]